MNIEDLKTLLEELCLLSSETEWVEFKEAKNNIHFDDLGKYFSALSNETNLKRLDFGWLVLGISDKPPRKIVGTGYRLDRPSLDRLKKEIADHTTNHLSFVEIYELNLPEGRVLMFQIPPAIRGIPTPWKGHYYGREGESLVPLSLKKMEQIRGQARQEDWSAQVCKGATIDDLDPEAILKARNEYKGKHPQKIEDIEKWDDVQFLNKCKLTIHGKITNASIILLGKQLKRLKLVEGRYPNIFISSRLASRMGEEAQHIRYKGLDKRYYKDLILALIREHSPISREKIDALLLDKLPEILTEKQKKTKIHNMLSELSRRDGKIENRGSRKYPSWTIRNNE